mgnify:CR=1 FL=1
MQHMVHVMLLPTSEGDHTRHRVHDSSLGRNALTSDSVASREINNGNLLGGTILLAYCDELVRLHGARSNLNAVAIDANRW